LVLDIPSKAHIPSLLSAFDNSPFYAMFRSTRPEDLKNFVVRSVFHLCGDGVLEDERYAAFMNGFAPTADVRYSQCPLCKRSGLLIFNSILSPLVNMRLIPLHLQARHLISLDSINSIPRCLLSRNSPCPRRKIYQVGGERPCVYKHDLFISKLIPLSNS
jgi:hypothetical protein